MDDPQTIVETPAEMVLGYDYVELLCDLGGGFIGWLGDQEILVAIFVAVLIYKYQRRIEQRALALALLAEVGLIIDRVSHIFEVQEDREHFEHRMCLHQGQDDWDSFNLIYRGNVSNLARLPVDLIIDLALLHGNLARFRCQSKEELLDVGKSGKFYGEVLLENVHNQMRIAGSKLDWISRSWFRRKITYKRWFAAEIQKSAETSPTKGAESRPE